MSLICLAPVSRPSSIPLPCSVPELLPPPHVPKELNTPSPTRPRIIRSFPPPGTRVKPSGVRSFHPTQPPGTSNLSNVCSKAATGIPLPSQTEIRCGSLSPAVLGRRSTVRSSVKNKNILPEKNNPSKSTQPQNMKTLNTININNNNKDDSKNDISLLRKPTSMAEKQNSVNKSWKTTNKQPPLQQNQTNSVHSKKPPPPRDQNRVPGPIFRRPEGKSVSAQGVGLNQPDLVKVSSPRTNQRNETIAKLKYTNDQISHYLKDAKLASKANAKGFEAMTIVVRYLAPEALSAAQLKKTISKLQMDICNQKLIASDLQGRMENQKENMKQKDNEWKKEKQCMQFNQREKFDSLQKKTQEEMEQYHLKIAINEELVNRKHEEQILEVGQRYEEELNIAKSQHNNIVSELNSNSARIEENKKKEWMEERARLEKQIADLKEESKGLQENMFKNSDFHVQIAHAKNINLHQEIDSLKTVVNMRTEEIHELRTERSRLEEKLELYDTTKENLKKMNAQVEDLREQINTKSDIERKVSEENRILHLSLEKEAYEKRRLSMENEQLLYKTCHATEPYCIPASEGSLEDPLSYTYNSLPIATPSRNVCRGSRPVSAPPGKLNMGLSPRSLFTEDAGSTSLVSPRVLEIVEKNESVSWKLEYEMDMMGGSPTFRRKPSPTNHMVAKIQGRGGTKSIERSSTFTPKMVKNSVMLSPQKFALKRSKSMRKKNIIPNFETWSESCESFDDEASHMSPAISSNDVERSQKEVKITGNCDDKIFGDISISSEIEIEKETDTCLEVKPSLQSNSNVASSECDISGEKKVANPLTDSLSTVSWLEDIEDQLAFDEFD